MAPILTYSENINSDSDKKFPYAIKEVEEKVNKELLTKFTGEKTTFLQVGPKDYFLPSGYRKEANHYYTFALRPNDVFIVTFPRSGTTLTQELVWLLANNLDFKKAAQIPLKQRCPFLEFSSLLHEEVKSELLKKNQSNPAKCEVIHKLSSPCWRYFQEMSERRFIKTHLPLSLLPPNLSDVGCKVIYVARNPKDVAVSDYHLCKAHISQGYNGDFEEFWKLFQKGHVPYSPYWEHIKEGWNSRNKDNLLFLFYEDMIKDLRKCIEKVSKFLGQSYKHEEIALLEAHLSIDNFKNNKSVNNEDFKELGVMLKDQEGFIRKGTNGGWRNYFDDKLNIEAERWIEDNSKGLDLQFSF
ncbi:sulfotransferase 1E1-like [Diorhabda carinulata]|uniref:sulfotransferase 1E1-like n=1 Tax=Diorhabda carinulata TaxID=1163345 RepID=UPI0025A1D173|nr:sulfotransferase 1E1-like [Diorhabda carinulata]